MRSMIAAAVQIACTDDIEANLEKLETHVREAARRGAQLVVLQELFEGVYFCVDEDKIHNARARPLQGELLDDVFRAGDLGEPLVDDGDLVSVWHCSRPACRGVVG